MCCAVYNRIKILRVNNFEEVENKVNDFLENDCEIAHLVKIDYRLEYNVVIVEYYVFNRDNSNNNSNNNMMIKQKQEEEEMEEESIFDIYNKMICACWGFKF
jgi:hypothetical protein